MKNIIRLLAFSLLWSSLAYALTVPEEITQEAMLPNSDTHHPLPLMAVWSTGTQWEAWEDQRRTPDSIHADLADQHDQGGPSPYAEFSHARSLDA